MLKRGIKRIALLLLVNLLLLSGLIFIFEGIIRVVRPEIRPIGTDAQLIEDHRYGASHGLRPEATGESNGALFTIDDQGFITYAAAPDSASSQVLFLGDSVTMGIGVDPDSSFAGRIQAKSPSMRVLNPSLIGYDLADYIVVLDHLLASDLAPDRVVLFWCLNDVYAGINPPSLPGGAVRTAGNDVMPFVRRHFVSYQWLKELATDRPLTYFEYDAAFYEPYGLQATESKRLLTQLRQKAEDAGVSLDVVLLPYAVQVREPAHPNRLQPQQFLGNVLDELDVAFHDAMPALMEAGGEAAGLYLFGDGIHFAPSGHRVLAEWLQETVLEVGQRD